MPNPTPKIYLLHGEDTVSLTHFIKKMQNKLGDASAIEMNTTKINAQSLDLDGLGSAVNALPFLADRRMVHVTGGVKKLGGASTKDKFLKIIEGMPQSTALVLEENKSLPDTNWLLKWGKKKKDILFVKKFSIPEGYERTKWIRGLAALNGGDFTPQAASRLGELIGEYPWTAASEIEKLLAFVNYARPVDIDDVEEIAIEGGPQGNFFQLIDSIGAANGEKATALLQSLMEEQEPLQLFFSLVSNYRLLLQTREILDEGGTQETVAKELGIHSYRAKKLTGHARHLDMITLENIYHRLLELDEAIKTGKILPEIALENFVTVLTI